MQLEELSTYSTDNLKDALVGSQLRIYRNLPDEDGGKQCLGSAT